MTLKFYYGSGSPFSWRVFFALEHRKIDYQLERIDFSEIRKPWYTELNPRQKVPVIVHDDFSLYESAAIVEYVEELPSNGPSLFPGDAQKRAIARRMVREVDTYQWKHNLALANELFFKPDSSKWDLDAISSGVEGMKKEMAFFDSRIEGDFICGQLSAVDFSLYPFIKICERFQLKKPDLGLVEATPPNLKAWKGRIEALPYYEKTYPPHWKS